MPDVDTDAIRAWCISVEREFEGKKYIPHQFLDKAIEYLRATCAELDGPEEPEPEPIEIPEHIEKYLRWKEGCTDSWGKELRSYLLYHTDGDNQYAHKPKEEYRAGWEAIRAMPYEQRVRIIEQIFGGRLEGGWPPDDDEY